MRIGITGAQGVGKTTLLNALRSERTFKDFAICDEVTRRVKSYGLPINEGGTDVTQKLIMNEHIYNVFMFNKMITDRTVVDGLVYSTWLHKNSMISASTMKHVKDVFYSVMPLYKHVFYIEPEFDLVEDGVRSLDKNFRDEIAFLFDAIIEKEKISVIRLKGSVRDRVSTVVDIVEGR